MRIIVTGSSRGIGRALTGRLLARGHQVWGLARSDQSDFAARHPGAFFATPCDVSDYAQVAAAARAIGAEWPGIDGLVTCAGQHGGVGRTTALDPRQWGIAGRVNLDGTFHAIHAFYPALCRAPRRAKIVCFSGGGSTKSRPHFSSYGAAKSGVVRLVETIAEEERATALDINVIAPGAMNTAMLEEIRTLGPAIAGDADYQAALKLKNQDPAVLERTLDCLEWMLSPACDGISGRLISAPWDPWKTLATHREELARSDIYTLRRIVPEDRGTTWADGPR